MGDLHGFRKVRPQRLGEGLHDAGVRRLDHGGHHRLLTVVASAEVRIDTTSEELMFEVRFHVSHAISGRTGGQVGPRANLAQSRLRFNQFFAMADWDPQAPGQVPQIGFGRVQAVAPPSKLSGFVAIRETHHPLRSALNWAAKRNMENMFDTFPTSHAPRS